MSHKNNSLQDASSSYDRYSVHVPFAKVCSHFGQAGVLHRDAQGALMHEGQSMSLQPMRLEPVTTMLPYGGIEHMVLQDMFSFDPMSSAYLAAPLHHVLILRVLQRGWRDSWSKAKGCRQFDGASKRMP